MSSAALEPIAAGQSPSTPPPGTSTTQPTNAFAGMDEQINMILALSDSDPDLKRAYEAYLAGNVAQMKAFILGSAFYKNNTAAARERIQAQKSQPGAYAQQLKEYVIATKKRLVQQGVKVTDAINAQIESAYLNGMGDDALDNLLITTNKLTLGGQAQAQTDSLKGFADSYGVGKFYNDAYWTQKATDLFAGTTTAQDIQKEIQQLSAGAYPAFAEGIMNGKSLDMQAGYIKTTVANTLGLDPNSLSWDDLNVKKFTQYMDPTTKKPALPPQWQVETETKKANYEQWANTPDGAGTINSLSMTVLRDMGLM
jgi:hypothetical protein